MQRTSHFNFRARFVSIALWICFHTTSSIASATTYYFAPDGHDTSDGRSPEHAWKSLGKVWSASLRGGDEVLLRRGGVWRETLTVPADGEAGRPIVIGAYGSGDRPCIDGGDPIDGSKFITVTSGVCRALVNHKLDTIWEDIGPPLIAAQSQAEVAGKEGSFWCDGTFVYVHPSVGRDPTSGLVHFEIPSREMCLEISKSHIAVRSIAIRHAARTDRGALTVWADRSLSEIELKDCDISYNCGRGAWLCGPATNSIRDILIKDNEFTGNNGSGLLLTLADGGQICGNTFSQNCRMAIEPWQGGIRLWSGGIRNLLIADNTIAEQRWNHDHDSSMGIHCDETGPHMTIRSNVVRNVDHAGIAVENTRGVTIEKNIVIDCNIGIFINRAGHDHVIRNNTVVDSRSQGIAIQGWLAHGVDAQPELVEGGRLLTRNFFENNLSIGSRWGNLKATNGGERTDGPLGNIFRHNDFGPDRAGFIEWGQRTLDRYDQWPVPGGAAHDSHT